MKLSTAKAAAEMGETIDRLDRLLKCALVEDTEFSLNVTKYKPGDPLYRPRADCVYVTREDLVSFINLKRSALVGELAKLGVEI